MTIRFITTGGTFDKVYYDAKSDYHIGDPMIPQILEEGNIDFEYAVTPVIKKDSLDITDEDRALIRQAVIDAVESQIIITHGTDSMVKTAETLGDIAGKTIVLVGAMQPARMRYTDAPYNIGVATTAVQLLEPGIYLAMHGRIFDPHKTRKNVAASKFESVAL